MDYVRNDGLETCIVTLPGSVLGPVEGEVRKLIPTNGARLPLIVTSKDGAIATMNARASGR